MRIAALALAIVGAICSAVVAVLLTGLAAFVQAGRPPEPMVGGVALSVLLLLAFAVLGIAGAAQGRMWMLTAAGVGSVVTSLVAILPAILFLLAAALVRFAPTSASQTSLADPSSGFPARFPPR